MCTRSSLLLLTLAAWTSACGSSHNDVRLEIRALPGAGGELTSAEDSGAPFSISSASVNIRDIELYLPSDVTCDDVEDDTVDCEDNEKLVIEGPFRVDLVAGEVAADIALPVGSYRRIDVRVDDEDDVTFAAAGELELGAESANVEIRLDFNEDIRFEGDVDIGASDSAATLLLGLDAAAWLQGVALAECVQREDTSPGPVVIGDDNSGSGSCSDLRNDVRANIEDSADLLGP